MASFNNGPGSCDAMMQQVAEATVESILVGIDTPEGGLVGPDTPPTQFQNVSGDWYSPSGRTTPFSTQPSWSFCETEASGQFRTDFRREASSYSACLPGSTDSEDDLNESSGLSATTVMLRNIPNKYTRSGLLAALVERGFDPNTDCNNLYLPMDAGSGCNLGYAFLNFTDHEKAMAFKRQFDGCRLPSAGSRKVCTVVWANKQGLFQHSNPPSLKESQEVAEVPTCKIFIGGLPITTTEADLVDYFERFGPIREASIVTNRQTGASRGFGFCEFLTPDCVDRVQQAQARRPHSVNCRVVSVRPYTNPDPAEYPQRAPEYAQYGCYGYLPPEPPTYKTVSFMMGNGILQPNYPSFSY